MASKTQQKNPHKISCFPSCFGSPKEGKAGSGRKKKPWYSWTRFRMRNSGRKTVPVDASMPDIERRGVDGDGQIKEIRSKSQEQMRKRQFSGLSDRIKKVVGVGSDRGGGERLKTAKYGSGRLQQKTQKIPVRDSSTSARDDTFQKLPAVGRKSGSKGTVSLPSSPETKKLFQTMSPFSPGKTTQTPSITNLSSMKTEKKEDPVSGYFDPIVGFSILMVAMAILLLWGRFCAIFCTSAWLYFIPRLRIKERSSEVARKISYSGELDVDSEEYKKRVILEGLLERNRKSPVMSSR